MRRFLLKLGLYFLPIAMYGTITVAIPYLAGELAPMEKIAREQVNSERSILYGRAYKDNFAGYKLVSARLRRAEVLALGSSRVMQFRSGLFNKDERMFYNAGGAADNVFQLRRFLEALEEDELPRVLIVGLDQDWFHPLYAQSAFANRNAPIDLESSIDSTYALNISRTVFSDWLTGDVNVAQLIKKEEPVHQEDAFGIAAIMSGSGFRSDGSRQYGPLVLNPLTTDQRFQTARQRMAVGGLRFAYGSEVSPISMDELNEFLAYCTTRGIYLIGFSPPYAPSIYASMVATGSYTYMPKLTSYLKGVFDAHGFAYFDFSDGTLPGTSDNDFLDGFHGSEFVYLQIYRNMLNSLPGVLSRYSDPVILKELSLEPRPNQFEVFAD